MCKQLQTVWRLVLLCVILIASVQCGGAAADLKAQAQTEPRSATGAVQEPGPDLEGKAAGEVKPFNLEGPDLRASVNAQTAPEVWLAFSVSARPADPSRRDSSNESGATTKVELPVAARDLLRAHWKVALTSFYNMDVGGASDFESYRGEMVTVFKSAQHATSELQKVEIDAPDGRRKISLNEANGLVGFIAKAAGRVIEQAKAQRK